MLETINGGKHTVAFAMNTLKPGKMCFFQGYFLKAP